MHVESRAGFARILAASTLLATGAAIAQSLPEEGKRIPAVTPGESFSAGSFANLNEAEGQPKSIDLSAVLGKKPVVLYYWIAGNRIAEELLTELDALRSELGADRIAMYAVAVPRPDRPAEIVRARIRELGVSLPVLSDDAFEIGSKLVVRSIPNVSIIDAAGKLRLTNGASLRQTLEYNMSLADGIRRTARTGTVGTYGHLARYHPVTELIGTECPDFQAALIDTKVERRWHDMLDPSKVNVLVFWSVDCPHCRQSLPEIDAWVKEHPNAVNVVSAAFVDDDATETKTREYCSSNAFAFPTLVDRDRSAREQFRVTSTPTIVIIRPDGVVDSVLLTGYGDFGSTIEKKRSELAPSRG
jgi:thiol-disulfide isomerase/thioredoxin